MKYFSVSETGLAIECHCISDLALAIENVSPMEGDPVQPVPWRQGANALDPGGLKNQFMRGTRRPVRDDAARSP